MAGSALSNGPRKGKRGHSRFPDPRTQLSCVAVGCAAAALVTDRLDKADPNRAPYIVLTAVAVIAPWEAVVWFFFIRGKRQ
jgi:hypothetical protein